MIIVLIWGLFSSCISEDHSDCYNRYWLDLSYTGDGTEEIFKEKIDKVSLFVFDENNMVVEEVDLIVKKQIEEISFKERLKKLVQVW